MKTAIIIYISLSTFFSKNKRFIIDCVIFNIINHDNFFFEYFKFTNEHLLEHIDQSTIDNKVSRH